MAIAVNRRGIEFLEYYPVAEPELDSDFYRPLLFTFIIIRYNGQFLLVHHRRRQSWELPGGHIEDGESARDCAVRELYEETSQTVDSLDFKAALKFHDGRRNSTFFSALFSGQLSSPAPFLCNDEISQITFWEWGTDIGYTDEIDTAVMELIRAKRI